MSLPRKSFAMVQTAPRRLEPMDLPIPEIDDDTEMKVLAAEGAPPSERAALLVRALSSRLTMYQWRFEDDGLVFEPPVDDG